MTLYRACEIYIDIMHGVGNNPVPEVTQALHIIRKHTGGMHLCDAMKWCNDYLATHKDQSMRTESEIRERIKECQAKLDGVPRFSNSYFALKHDVNSLKWVLKEDG